MEKKDVYGVFTSFMNAAMAKIAPSMLAAARNLGVNPSLEEFVNTVVGFGRDDRRFEICMKFFNDNYFQATSDLLFLEPTAVRERLPLGVAGPLCAALEALKQL